MLAAAAFLIWPGIWSKHPMHLPAVLGLALALCIVVHVSNNWAILLAMLALLVYIVAQLIGLPVFAVRAGNTGVLAWKFRRQLMLSLRFRAFRPRKERP